MTTTALAEVAAAAADPVKPADDKKSDAPAALTPDDLDVRAAASARGWVPKKAFKGDPERWVDADKFLERAENEMPLLKARNKKLEKDMAEMRGLVTRVVKNTKAQADRAVAQAIAELEAKKETAIKEGDVAEVKKLDKKIDETKKSAADDDGDDEPAAKKGGDLSDDDKRAYNAWAKDNPWFKTDKRLTKFAEGVFMELAESDEDWDDKTLAQQLKAVAKEVKKEFPHKFAQTKQKEPPAVEGGGGSLGGDGKKGYADLPAEAKQICDDMVRQKIMTREQYLKEYRW